jgi:probable rRNA maturation factor
MQENFSLTNKTKGSLPRLPFVVFKNKVLGKKYDLSIVFVGEKTIQKLNKEYRKIHKPTDILSFSLSKNSGEIFICEKIAKKKAKEFEMTYTAFLPFLFIHGLVHLKGYDHGKKMELEESKYRKYFTI